MNILSKLKNSLSKSSNFISNGIENVFINKKLDDNTIEELEDLLITADLGVDLATQIINNLKKEKFKKDISISEVKSFLKKQILPFLKSTDFITQQTSKPHIILMCGVNGNGKTTCAGKFAYLYNKLGQKVMLAACDTYRAAAVEQLEIWSKRSNSLFFKKADKSDPASVAYQALEQSLKDNVNVLIIDTAGRLQNKINLMDELSKISRALKKIDSDLSQENVLVIDGNTGQNAIRQVEEFNKATNLSSLIFTKLDGTTKAGILIAVAKKFGLPIKAIGIGEKIEDLKHFNKEDFLDALLNINN